VIHRTNPAVRHSAADGRQRRLAKAIELECPTIWRARSAFGAPPEPRVEQVGSVLLSFERSQECLLSGERWLLLMRAASRGSEPPQLSLPESRSIDPRR